MALKKPDARYEKPIYSSSHFSIDIDGMGKDFPTLRSVDGGGVQAEVIGHQIGIQTGVYGEIFRQLGKPKYSDIKITLGLADAVPFWAWISETLKGTPSHKNGAIIAADYNFHERARRSFQQAMICAIGFPKWDANAKEQANLSITLAVEKVTFEKAEGNKITPKDESETKQKQILACNFTLTFEGFDTIRVTKVDPMEIKVKTIEHHHGNRIEPLKVPGRIEWPNLVFYVPETDAEQLRQLHNQHMAGQERKPGAAGRTALLTFHNNKKEEKGSMKIMGLQIFNVSAEKGDATSEEMKLTKVECAIESIEEFKLK